MRVRAAQCRVLGCMPPQGHSVVRGYCPKHLYRFETHGDPLKTKVAVGTPEEKLNHYGWTVVDSGCWLWDGPVGQKGYGRLGDVETQRIAYETWVGPIPAGQQVRHKCDTPLCIAPAHLELGTIGDNMRDKFERGRQAKGSRVGTSKLTEAQVAVIKMRLDSGETATALGKEFGVSGTMIGYIRSGKWWAHVVA